MAVKGIKIDDSISSGDGGSNLTATFLRVGWMEIRENDADSRAVDIEIHPKIFRNESACDNSKDQIEWLRSTITPYCSFTIASSDWESASESPNDRIYGEWETKLEELYSSVTLVNY